MTDSVREIDEGEPAAVSPDNNSRSNRSEFFDFLWFLIKLALFMLILRSFIVSPFNIPSESMHPRLLVGDYLLVSKWNYGYSRYSLPFNLPLIPGRIFAEQPERGDVVVFKAPPHGRDDYIKRVIGLPGDHVQVKGDRLLLNGTIVPRERIADFLVPVSANMLAAATAEGSPYPCYEPQFEERSARGVRQCRYPRFRETLPDGRSYNVLDLIGDGPGDNTQEFTVPAGSLFLMGDNRDRSADSRFPAVEGGAIGIVPQKFLVGKALVSVFSTDGSASWLKPWTWGSTTRWDRIGEGF